MKWFYFTTISSMTIGYGNVHPVTDYGKIFVICFSIVGIALMMTLLKSCGEIITALNEWAYTIMKRYVLYNKLLLSDELMAVISNTVLYVFFMVLVVWHDAEIDEGINWSSVDCLYFWIVTFTTVGFGDKNFPLDVEIDHLYELLFLRVFGLSFIAGIIDSINKYIKYRNKDIGRRSSQHIRNFVQSRLKGKCKMNIYQS